MQSVAQGLPAHLTAEAIHSPRPVLLALIVLIFGGRMSRVRSTFSTAKIVFLTTLVITISSVFGPAVASASTSSDVALNVLVLDDGSPMVAAIADRLTAEGQPITRLELNAANRGTINSDYLVSVDANGVHAKFMGVVSPNEAPAQLSAAERSELFQYEETFNVRQVNSYTWAHPEVGLNYAANPGYIGQVDGMVAAVTDAGRNGPFRYLRGSLTLDDISPVVQESYGYLAVPLPEDASNKYTPLLTAPIPGTDATGSLIGVYEHQGREQMVITFASNGSQQHWKTLSHGVVSWLTRGISLSYQRNYFGVQIDDVLLPDSLWSIDGNCTIGDGCDPVEYPEDAPGATARMTPTDVDRLVNWQRNKQLHLDLVYNGFGATEHRQENGGADPLEDALLTNKQEFRWVNHTWSHPYLGCVQDFSVAPWQCATDALGATQYVGYSTVRGEISKNHNYSKVNALPNYSRKELVTGEHSGLKSAPQMSVDNPNLAPALDSTRIRWIASDASREAGVRSVGGATTVPRYPMNIFYNTATKAEAVDEYNWIYTSAADGGSGLCETHPDTMTCINPLDLDSGFDSYIAEIESRIALGHLLGNDPRPHYAHQSNLAAEGILYPVLDRIVDGYRSTFADNSPVMNPTLTEAGEELVRQRDWAAQQTQVSATIKGNQVTLHNSGSTVLTIPLTLPTDSVRETRGGRTISAHGTAYAGEQSGAFRLRAGGVAYFGVPQDAGFPSEVTWPRTPQAPAGVADQLNLQGATREVELPQVEPEVLPVEQESVR